jgi:hypothetical protein
MGHYDDRTGDVERPRCGIEIIDPLGEPPSFPRTFREAHVEMVYGNNPDVGRGGCNHASPHVGPGWIAVHAQESDSRVGYPIVQHMPRTLHVLAIEGGYESRPFRLETLQTCRGK